MKRSGIVLLSCMLVTSLAMASADPILQRQDMMENTRDALKAMVGMVRGEAPFDATAVKHAL